MDNQRPHEFHHLDPDPRSEGDKLRRQNNIRDAIRMIDSGQPPPLTPFLEKYGLGPGSHVTDIPPITRSQIMQAVGDKQAADALNIAGLYDLETIRAALQISEAQTLGYYHPIHNRPHIKQREHTDDLPAHFSGFDMGKIDMEVTTARQAVGEFLWNGHTHNLVIPAATLAIQIHFFRKSDDAEMAFSCQYRWSSEGIHVEIMPSYIVTAERERWRNENRLGKPVSHPPMNVRWVANW